MCLQSVTYIMNNVHVNGNEALEGNKFYPCFMQYVNECTVMKIW